ncbi:hypothetical protein DUNSADRAFT_18200 [Dunaliella salina]|uniref:Encoded protein n=1 Tax=Dunaliella salina TaxID=3046 RepID=A0ABQ7G0G0_DUNSA|nr:hypothetical protein DUNSADRAFT_18200 [Dunaliella salina]|eukprot:KAF5828090.1 hypothetical protein DUNSADRAFT_18200 [Dunaliella salina]
MCLRSAGPTICSLTRNVAPNRIQKGLCTRAGIEGLRFVLVPQNQVACVPSDVCLQPSQLGHLKNDMVDLSSDRNKARTPLQIQGCLLSNYFEATREERSFLCEESV